jgi:hypothetical protein
MILKSRFAAAGLSALFLLAPCMARAGDKALAESLFQEGRKLLDAGKPADACGKFAASQRQDPSPGTLINLGKCNEAQGKTATAWAAYKEAESLARNMNRAEQEKLASERASELEGKLSRLTVNAPPGEIPGLIVRRGGTTLSSESLGVAAPVDPGEVEVEASAPGHETWKGKVTVGKANDNASIAIPSLVESGAAAPALAPIDGAAPAPAASPTPAGGDVTADTGKSSPTLGYVLTGVGGAALVVGGVFGYLASQQASDAKDDPALCPDKKCSAKGRDEIDSAEGKALISTIGVGAGLAAVGVGVVLILTSGGSAASKARAAAPRQARFIPIVSPSGGGFALGGAF